MDQGFMIGVGVFTVVYPLVLVWLFCRAINKGAHTIAFGLGRKRDELAVPGPPKAPAKPEPPMKRATRGGAGGDG